MDGTLALIWLISSLTDMTLNDCPTDCLDTEKLEPQIFYQFADVQFNEKSIGEEFYLGYDSHRRRGPFRPTYGLSLTSEGDAWFGIGWKWSSQYVNDSPLFIETSMMPGAFMQGDGPDIGGALQFRSAIGVGYEFDNGSKVTISYDHRSNADTQKINPGLETLSIRYAVNFN
jgi:hypothetical protein